MATREVLPAGTRDGGRISSAAVRPATTARDVTFRVVLAEAARANVNQTCDFFVYGSLDQFATRQFLGSCQGWTGGTYVNKQGQTVTRDSPAFTIEGTAGVRAMDILVEVELALRVRYAIEVDDD